MITVLFSSAGRRVALIECFRNAARLLGTEITILAADMAPSWSPACHIADRAFRVDRCTSADFIPQMLEICREHGVHLIVPTIDTELMTFSKNKALFADMGTTIHISDPEFITVAADKAATANRLKAHYIPVPKTWKFPEMRDIADQMPFPLIVKPRFGSCSKGIAIVHSAEDLARKTRDPGDWLVQQCCSGQEYTVNCCYDRKGNCVACVPHFRKFVRDGEVCFAQTERIPEFSAIAHRLSDIFPGIWGCICFQGFKQEDGRIQVIEINARFGGGYPLCDQAGGTFVRWILQELMGIAPDYHDNWREGFRMLRYDDAVFMETES